MLIVKKNYHYIIIFGGHFYRTKNFKPDYRYTKNFGSLDIDELILIDISKKIFKIFRYDILFANNCFVPISVGGGIK